MFYSTRTNENPFFWECTWKSEIFWEEKIKIVWRFSVRNEGGNLKYLKIFFQKCRLKYKPSMNILVPIKINANT